MEKLFNRFITELPEQMESIRQCRKNRDWTALTKAVHQLHGATAICGVPAMNHLVEALENAAHNEQEKEIERFAGRAGERGGDTAVGICWIVPRSRNLPD